MRGKGLPAVRLASVAATSFRDACARPGLPLIEALPGNQHDITGPTSREQAAYRRQRPGASAGEDRAPSAASASSAPPPAKSPAIL